MKKILLTTTALVATAGFAMAEVSVSGSADVGLKYTDSGVNKTTVESDVDINFAMSGETDGGIAWTASGGLSNDTNSGNTGASTGSTDTGVVSISGDFGTIGVGDVASALSSVGMGDIGYDGIGIDDEAEVSMVELNSDVHWKYAMDGISLVLSTNTHNDNAAISAGWTSGAMTIAVAHQGAGTIGGETNNAASVSTSVGGMALTVVMADSSTTATGSSQGMTLSLAPSDSFGTVTFAMSDNHGATDASYGVGFSKGLGGGATLAGAYGTVDNVAKADLGISFSF
jgi:outer membrane protein OmpU